MFFYLLIHLFSLITIKNSRFKKTALVSPEEHRNIFVLDLTFNKVILYLMTAFLLFTALIIRVYYISNRIFEIDQHLI